MGRKRIHADGAARARAWRERQGRPVPVPSLVDQVAGLPVSARRRDLARAVPALQAFAAYLGELRDVAEEAATTAEESNLRQADVCRARADALEEAVTAVEGLLELL